MNRKNISARHKSENDYCVFMWSIYKLLCIYMVYKSVTAENSKYTRYFDMKHDNPPVSIWRKKTLRCVMIYIKKEIRILLLKREIRISASKVTHEHSIRVKLRI